MRPILRILCSLEQWRCALSPPERWQYQAPLVLHVQLFHVVLCLWVARWRDVGVPESDEKNNADGARLALLPDLVLLRRATRTHQGEGPRWRGREGGGQGA